MARVIDTNTNCTGHLEDLKRRGVEVIGRYYAARGDKRLTQTEAQAISDAGLKLFIVYEDSGSPVLSVDRGRNDAQIALRMARFIGQPKGSAIYFALEHLPDGYGEADIPGVKLYFEGIRRAFAGEYAVGCYANGSALDALLDAKLIQYAWLSASLGFHGSREFLKTDRWHLQQEVPIDLNWGGVSVDTNKVQHAEFGAWSLPAPSEEAVAALAGGTIAAAVAPTVTDESKPALLDRLAPNAAKVEELADQGSRIAQHIKAFKGMLWKGGGTVVTAGTAAATLVDPNKGNAAVVGSWGAQHPFLLALICVGVTAAIVAGYAYYKIKQTEKGLVSAANDGRYSPRGEAA